MSDLIKFSIPGKPDYVQMVRLAIASAAGNANFDMEAIEDIKVSVGEACKNVTCHEHEGFSAFYEVSCEISEDKIIISVEDNCDTHEIAKDRKPCANCPDEGNLALFVIESLMDEVAITHGKSGNKCIRMVKNRC